MPGGAVVLGTTDTSRIEAPVTMKTYFMCVFAAFGGIFFGYDTGWMGGVLGMPYFIQMYTHKPYPQQPFNAAHLPPDFALPAWEKSLMTSILSAGTFFGALIAGDIADFIGRRPTIIGGCVVFSVGCILEIAGTDALALFVIGRLVAGAGVGFISAIIILYMSEIAPKKVRGALVSGYQFCITIGILIANCVVYATQDRLDTGSYRIPIGVQFLWALILGTGLFFLPESPRFWVKKGNVEKATIALASVRSQPRDSAYVQDELAEIIANHEYEQAHVPQTSYVGGWLNCFKGSLFDGSSNLRRTVLGAGLQCMQQFTGINFIFYFGTSFFQTLGTIDNPFLISLITTLVNVLSTPLSFYIIERFGRRRILLIGSVGMIVAQYIVAIIGVAAPNAQVSGGNPPAVKAEIAFICLNIAFFATTWGPAAWVVVGEVFPLPIRSRGVGISTASNWFWNCIIGVITPYMVSEDKGNLGPKVFFVWGSLCCLSLTFAYFLVPETKGLSLEQVDQMLSETTPRTSSTWKPHQTWAAAEGHTHGVQKEATIEEKESVGEKAV
ncbi:sugar transporter family protein [Exidia glandulosa HHB12029]|uniref:Sugar transporter family protein n=1 Tax=Exidia glandulosa HHB12029 TaxID=1314781 RepID=A0A165NGK2_EXIGL|nr:sugar transporter family protein [Exidia glandulosa HHB12029]